VSAAPQKPGHHRVPPHNKEAEASVLGGILLRNETIHQAAEHLGPGDFYIPAHAVTFQAMLELERRGKPIDPVSLEEQLKGEGNLEKSGGLAHLVDLASRVPTAENIGHYINIVKDKSQLRRLIQISTEIAAEAYAEPTEAQDFLDRSEQSIFEITQRTTEKSFLHVKPLIDEVFRKVDQRDPDAKGGVTGVGTGYHKLDELTGGFQSGDLIVIAARPSMGKTALALNIAQNAAREAGVPVLVFSLEMNGHQLIERMLCSEARVDLSKFRLQRYDDDEWLQLTNAASELYKAPIYIDDTPMTSVLQIRNKSRRFRATRSIFEGADAPGIILVDYMQLMRGPDGRTESREREISEISRGLKALAKELNMPVVALSQLNRMVEMRQDRRPRLSDLRESGAIEQDADLVLFIYRDVVYNPETPSPKSAELLLAKHRNGPTGQIPLVFLTEFTRFENPSLRQDTFGGPPPDTFGGGPPPDAWGGAPPPNQWNT
jgi:replicative DNA helicase